MSSTVKRYVLVELTLPDGSDTDQDPEEATDDIANAVHYYIGDDPEGELTDITDVQFRTYQVFAGDVIGEDA